MRSPAAPHPLADVGAFYRALWSAGRDAANGWRLAIVLRAGRLTHQVAVTFSNPFLFLRVGTVAFAMIRVGLALAERERSPALGDRGVAGTTPALH